MKKYFLIIIFALILIISPKNSNADVIPEGEIFIEGCNKIININDYKEYDFFLEGEFLGNKYEPVKIENDKCIKYDGYKFAQFEIYAQKKYSKSKIQIKSPESIKSDRGIYVKEDSKEKAITTQKYKINKNDNGFEIMEDQKIETNTSIVNLFIPNFDYVKFFKALILTILTELMILILVTNLLFKKTNINKKLILSGIIPSLITLPIFWITTFLFNLESNILFIIAAEIIIAVIETLIIQKILNTTLKESLILSLLCNIASIIIGLIIL